IARRAGQTVQGAGTRDGWMGFLQAARRSFLGARRSCGSIYSPVFIIFEARY
ncbi:hypothetical protein A2U01_0092369, partial [Trifolium medium]|nr:hypothetical protein [Trifolium medium]